MAAVQTDFLRGITHDLQTPLTSIRALASELQGSEVVDAAARIDLETIAHQADRLRRMVGQLLAVSRLEVGELTPRQEVFRAAPLVRRTWDALRDTAHGFALEEAGPPHLVVADPDRLEQVLWALMDNAVKYSPAGSQVTVRIEGRAAPSGNGLVSEISISDAGPGMDADDRGARLRAVLPRRRGPPPGARWQRDRPLRRARPGRGDGRPDPRRQRARAGHLDHPSRCRRSVPTRSRMRRGQGHGAAGRGDQSTLVVLTRPGHTLQGALQGSPRTMPAPIQETDDP